MTKVIPSVETLTGGTADRFLVSAGPGVPLQLLDGPTAKTALGVTDGATGPAGPTGATGATGPQGDPGEGVAAGGTTGQVLAKASATDYDTEWVDPAGGGSSADAMHAQTGVYYNAQEPDAFGSAVTITANVLYLFPTCHETTETWNEIYTYVNAIGSGGTCRMGIYTSDHANGPTFNLLKNAGTVSVGTTGLKTISSLAQSIDGGKIVYLALLCDVTWTNLGTTFANLKKRLIRGHSGGFNFGGITGYQKAATYASGLPSTVTGVTSVQTNCPTIGMRI